MNLGSPDDASNARPFNDLLLTASDWSREDGLWDPRKVGVRVGPRGWPIGLASDQQLFVRLGGSQGGDFPGVTLPPEGRLQPGRYEFALTGTGSIQMHLFYADGTFAHPVTKIEGGAIVPVAVEKPIGSYLAFDILASDRADPLIPESFRLSGSEGIWNPAYTDPLRIFRTLRVMDLLVANDSTLTDSYPDHYTVATNTGSGILPEWLGELSERTGADLWINVPDTYTDRLVRQMADRIRSTLPPDRKLVVEFSNETWNYAKSQTLRLQEEGKGFYPNASEQEALYRNSARRALNAHDIFADVLGENRIIRVLGGQAPWTRPAEVMFDEYVDVLKGPDPDLALAGYIGWEFGLPENRDATIALGEDGVRKGLLDGPNGVPAAVAGWELHRPLLDRYGVNLHVYEGGPHLRQEGGGPDDLPLIELFKRVSDDPGDCCGALLDAADRFGVDRFCWFNYTGVESRQGFWPVFQWTGQPPTNKYLALERHARKEPPMPDEKSRTLADLIADRKAARERLDAAGKALGVASEEVHAAMDWSARTDEAIRLSLPGDSAVLLEDGSVIVPPSSESRIVPLVKASDVPISTPSPENPR